MDKDKYFKLGNFNFKPDGTSVRELDHSNNVSRFGKSSSSGITVSWIMTNEFLISVDCINLFM